MVNRVISPTGSYKIEVPSRVVEDDDNGVTSLWVPGDDTLLQLSSRRRDSGDQIGAKQRLEERLHGGGLQNPQRAALSIAGCPDAFCASGHDDDDGGWMFAYAVWPDLSVFMTISHPDGLHGVSAWASDAIHSLTRS